MLGKGSNTSLANEELIAFNEVATYSPVTTRRFARIAVNGIAFCGKKAETTQ